MVVLQFLVVLLATFGPKRVHTLSLSPKNKGPSDLSDVEFSVHRRGLLSVPIGIGGAIVYGRLVADAVERLSRGALAFPEAHEHRVEAMISKALMTSIPMQPNSRALRVLEVGIGKDCRLIRRGLYTNALEQLSDHGVSKLELNAVDICMPDESVLEGATMRFKEMAGNKGIEADFHFLQKSITSRLNFPDGWFDAIICSLTLCSVDDQDAAIKEIKRLVRSNGGTFGYVEHVAVKSDEPYRLLELQQKAFDPLQQVLADNCHLHRFTDGNIANIFDVNDAATGTSSLISQERFLVDGMWPVSCQVCGIIQRMT